jgi:hypothetical protein
VLSAWVACELAALAGVRGARRYVGVAAFGSVLPDLVKAFYLLKTYGHIDLIAFSVPLATPLGAILMAGLVSSFFDSSELRSVSAYMAIGVAIHLVWDFTLHPYGGGELLFFPLSFEQSSLGWIWSDSILPLAIIAIPAVMLLSLGLVHPRSAGPRGHRRQGL